MATLQTAQLSGFTEADIIETGLPTLPFRDYTSRGTLRVTSSRIIDVNPYYQSNQDRLLLRDTDAIKQKIRNILSTPIGSEYFEPEYGSMIPYRIHDPINDGTAWILRTDTVIALQRWMGNLITVDMAKVKVALLYDTPDGEGYYIFIPYRINETNEYDELAVEVYP